jgi:hypothetical protein
MNHFFRSDEEEIVPSDDYRVEEYERINLFKNAGHEMHKFSVYHYMSTNFTMGLLDAYFLKHLDFNMKFENDLHLNLSLNHPLFKQNLRSEFLQMFAKSIYLKDIASPLLNQSTLPKRKTKSNKSSKTRKNAKKDVKQEEEAAEELTTQKTKITS